VIAADRRSDRAPALCSSEQFHRPVDSTSSDIALAGERHFAMEVPMRLFAALLLIASAATANAAEPSFSLTLKDHHFTPAELTIPANTRVRFMVKNLDATAAEFESDDFKAEKVIPAGREVAVMIPALKPGTYEFHDEYNEAASKSRLIVK
jgi:heme/copper-type cytochrome/quinol oxidase subunit 2